MSAALKKCISGISSPFTAVLGTQWGDQGKGKLINYLSDNYDIIVRFNGGNNSGHVIFKGNTRYSFNLLPSAILNERTQNLVGNGCVVDLEGVCKQLDMLAQKGISYKNRIFISDRAHLVIKYHVHSDLFIEKRQGIGSTGRGIGPAYACKAHRVGLRVGDLRNWDFFLEKYERLVEIYGQKSNYEELQKFKAIRERIFGQGIVVDGVSWINKQIDSGKKILAEGANGALLDVDLGTYPYVAANSTTIGSVATGLGISPRKIDTVIGVMKAYTTRVQQGPFTSELIDSTGYAIRQIGDEYGIVTGRQRRCGWLDLSLVKYSAMLNGYDSLNVTKLDVLDRFDEIKVAVDHKLYGQHIDLPPQTIFEFGRIKTIYKTFKGWKKSLGDVKRKEDLPQEALEYLKFIEKYTQIPISWVGVGRENNAFIPML